MMSNTGTSAYSFKLGATALADLDVLRQTLGMPSRGHVLDLAVTTAWRQKISSEKCAGLWSPVTDGSRQDEILRRLHDLARIELRSMSEVAEAAIRNLVNNSVKETALDEEPSIVPSR